MSLCSDEDTRQLNEGLIKTYPIDRTIEFAKRYFKTIKDEDIHKELSDGNVWVILVRIPDVFNNKEIITRAMNSCGYHFAKTRPGFAKDGVEYVWLQFEPKFENDISIEIRAQETHLYHITPLCNVGDILHSGLQPSFKNQALSFPERVYALRGSTHDDIIIELTYQLSKHNTRVPNDGNYAVLDIDLKKIPRSVKMYQNPNHPCAIFFSDNIRPNSIIGVGYIDLNDRNPRIEWK